MIAETVTVKKTESIENTFYHNAYVLQPLFDAVSKYTTCNTANLAYDVLNIYSRLKEMSLDNFVNQERVVARVGVREFGTDFGHVIDFYDEDYVGGIFILTGFYDENADEFTFRLYKKE